MVADHIFRLLSLQLMNSEDRVRLLERAGCVLLITNQICGFFCLNSASLFPYQMFLQGMLSYLLTVNFLLFPR